MAQPSDEEEYIRARYGVHFATQEGCSGDTVVYAGDKSYCIGDYTGITNLSCVNGKLRAKNISCPYGCYDIHGSRGYGIEGSKCLNEPKDTPVIEIERDHDDKFIESKVGQIGKDYNNNSILVKGVIPPGILERCELRITPTPKTVEIKTSKFITRKDLSFNDYNFYFRSAAQANYSMYFYAEGIYRIKEEVICSNITIPSEEPAFEIYSTQNFDIFQHQRKEEDFWKKSLFWLIISVGAAAVFSFLSLCLNVLTFWLGDGYYYKSKKFKKKKQNNKKQNK